MVLIDWVIARLDSERTVLVVSSLPWVWGICFFGTIPGGANGSSDLTKCHSCCCSYFWFFMIIPMNTPIQGVALLHRTYYLCGSKCNSSRNLTKRQKKHILLCAQKQQPVECALNYVEIVRESVYTQGSWLSPVLDNTTQIKLSFQSIQLY